MKSLLLYLAMVGLPLAGLFGILQVGSRLDAPPSVGGRWRVDAPAAGLARTIDISQSGEHVSVDVAGARLRGVLRGDTLVATGPGGRELRVSLDRAAEPERLVGTVEVPGHEGRAPAAISAVRVPAERGGGRH